MLSLIYLANRAPTEIATELGTAGYRVWEALSVSEVLHLCEHEQVDVIVIAPDMQSDAIIPLRLKQIAISLEPQATAKDLIWQLEQLFPKSPARIH